MVLYLHRLNLYKIYEVDSMREIAGILVLVALVAYVAFGTKAVGYVKREIFGLETVFITSISHYYAKQIAFGIALGWLAIPIALIHHLVTNRD